MSCVWWDQQSLLEATDEKSVGDEPVDGRRDDSEGCHVSPPLEDSNLRTFEVLQVARLAAILVCSVIEEQHQIGALGGQLIALCLCAFASAAESKAPAPQSQAEQSIAAVPILPRAPELFDLSSELRSRSITPENPTGEPGRGGQAASPLGVGRKGSPAWVLAPGESAVLCDIVGAGTIRRFWLTTFNEPRAFRSSVIRGYWDGQEHPSIEAPLGDFFGFAHGKVVPYQSAAHSVGVQAGLNFWLPMPFRQGARLTLTNEGEEPLPVFFQIDYTLGDRHGSGVGRLHVLFRRENPTTLRNDFELLPKRVGRGRFIGSVIGVRTERAEWWGEGEMKAYLDGDSEFATIVGTGSEDYVGLSFGLQETPYRFHGASLHRGGFSSMYRWHIRDPLVWHEEIRVTIQQIGFRPQPPAPGGRLHSANEAQVSAMTKRDVMARNEVSLDDYLAGLIEIQDDWSAATFWYEPIPSAPLPALPGLSARTADLWDAE